MLFAIIQLSLGLQCCQSRYYVA